MRMTQEVYHHKIENIDKRTVKMNIWQILTLISIVGSCVFWWCNREQNTAIDNTEVRGLIKQMGADLTNKINSNNTDLTNKINNTDVRDSIRVMTLSNQININHIKNDYKMNSIDDRVKHLEFGAVTEKHTSRGLAFIPVK